ncbi:MAG: S8 family serine peptidase [Gemmatimonadales bacterium]
MARRLTLSRLGAFALLSTTLLAACADQEPAGPTTAVAVRQNLQVSQPTARPDRYLVSFKTAEPATFAAQVQALGGTIERRSPLVKLATVSGIGATGSATLRKLAGVEFIAQDMNAQFLPPPNMSLMQVRELSTPGPRPNGTDQSSAFFFPLQWNMRQVAADLAWNSTPGGSGELVCILDTGIDPDHLDLSGKVDPTKLVSFISAPLFSGDLDPLDYNFHGTATAGYVSSNGFGMASVAPDAKLCSAKVLNVLGSGSFADVIAGIVWASEAGADVINMSLGAYFDRSVPGGGDLVTALTRAVAFANNSGAVVVASAGNSAINLDEDPATFISVPAQIKGVISVGATAPFNQANFDGLASYSNFGGRTGVTLMAPGGDFVAGNTLDFVLSACSQYQLTLPFACGSTSYVFASGTSESAPHVSGAMAVVESQRGQNKPTVTSNCVTRNTDVIGPSKVFGAGRLNVFKSAACTVR